MPNYKNGKIYAIRSYQTDEIYIGSTIQALKERLRCHKKDLKRKTCSSKLILQYEDAYIELIEECPCDNKEQLLRKEGEHIRATNCVNKKIAGRTDKEYQQENKEKRREYVKKYREENKEQYLQSKKREYANLSQEQRDKRNARKRELRLIKKNSV